MAAASILVILLMWLLHPKVIQPVKRVLIEGGATFYANIEIGHPSMTTKAIFEFDRGENTMRNKLPNESEDSSFYVDVVYGPMLEFLIAGQVFELPLVFNPYYEPFLSTNLEISIGMGPTSPIWLRYPNITYTHNGIIFEDISSIRDKVLEYAVDCDVASTTLCDFDAIVYKSTSDTPLSLATPVRVSLNHDPVTYFPSDLFYAIKGELELSITDIARWPDVTLCTQTMQCFQIRKQLLYLLGHQYSDNTIKAWDNDFIQLGTSLVLGLDFHFFRGDNKMAVVPRSFVLEYSYSSVLIIFVTVVCFLYMSMTSYDINGPAASANIFPLIPRAGERLTRAAVIQKIFIISRRVIEILIFIVIPIILMTNQSLIDILMNESVLIFWFVLTLHVLFLVSYTLANFYNSILTNRAGQSKATRTRIAFIALCRNAAFNCDVLLIIFSTSLEIYAGETINQFHLLTSFMLSILVGTYAFTILMFALAKSLPIWYMLAALSITCAGITIAVNILYFLDPYMDTILIGYGLVSRVIILPWFLTALLICLISGIVLGYPYIDYVYEGRDPQLKKTE